MQTRPQLRLLATMIACALLGSREALAAADPTEVLRALHRQDEAVERVGFRLASANADLCPGGADAGFSVHTLEQYGPAYRAAAAALFDLGGPPGVMAVAPSSPAEAAGLREGDGVVAVDNLASPAPPKLAGRSDFSRTGEVQARIVAATRARPMALVVLRAGQRLELRVDPARACRSLFQLTPDASLKGEADGDYVQVSSELVSLAASDDELAALLAHELAHNVLGHRARLDALHVDRGLLAVLGRNARLIRGAEREADRLGVYLLARAGYDPLKALAYWGKVRAAAKGFGGDPTHPGWTERLALVKAETERIAAAGAPAREVPLPPDLAAEIPRR